MISKKELRKLIKSRKIWRPGVKISSIIGNRHKVVFPDNGSRETIISFCNICGGDLGRYHESNLMSICSSCGRPLWKFVDV